MIQIRHNMIEKLAGGKHLAIYRRGRRFELGTTENKSSKWPERDSNPDRRIASSTCRPLGHVASLKGLEGVFLPSRTDVLLNLSYLLTILSRNKVLFNRFVYFLCSVKSSVVKCLFNVLCCFFRYPCCTTVGV